MKILITESKDFSPKALVELQKYFEVIQHNFSSLEELVNNIDNIDALFVRLRFKLTQDVIEKAPKLKYILTAATGLDHINIDYFESRGGRIISLKGEVEFLESIPSTAEHTWALLLALSKKMPLAFDDVKEGNWNRDKFKGNNLSQKKIGILGLGRVGKQVADFAKAFGMTIGYFDVELQNNHYKSFDNPTEMFAWADIISIHIPYNLENENYVSEKLLLNCRHNAVLINTSRGNIWDENAVAKLIQHKKIKGVATDVLQNEFEKGTISQNPLVLLANQKENIIITPHIAGATYESMTLTEDFIVDKFIASIKY